MADKKNIVVLGAGVVGLTTALVLAQKHPNSSITVVAKHMPGDYDIEYASPWAGANYLPVGAEGTLLRDLERATGPVLFKICRETPEAGIHFQKTTIYNRVKDGDSATAKWFKELLREDASFKDIVFDFRSVPKSELSPDIDSATSFTSVCINTAIYLPWLLGQCLKHNVFFKRGVVKHISEAASLHHSKTKADIIINCTGLSSGRLGGVQDPKVFPGRGQIVLVRQEPVQMTAISGTDDGPEETIYTMTRAAGGGTILGGCLQLGSWESQPDPSLANRIMARAVKLVPELTGGKGAEALDIVRHGVGLRPMREGGPRVEKERIDGVWVVHNYGHGGYGYQSSFGTAEEAVRLVGECGEGRAKL